MCWGIYLGIPLGIDFPTKANGKPVCAWRVENPWIPLAFGDAFECWIVGHGIYCSCGCVVNSDDKSSVVLCQDARRFIADIADSTGQISVLAHWTSNAFDNEELPFDLAVAVHSDQLRTEPIGRFRTDAFYWVQGIKG